MISPVGYETMRDFYREARVRAQAKERAELGFEKACIENRLTALMVDVLALRARLEVVEGRLGELR